MKLQILLAFDDCSRAGRVPVRDRRRQHSCTNDVPGTPTAAAATAAT